MPRTAFRAALGLFVLTTATACGAHPAATTPASATAAAAPTHAAAAPSCKQQYHAWKYGPARPVGKKLTAALDAVQSVGATEDIPALLAALKTVGKDAARLERYPIPACADPHGYWKKLLARIQAAGDNAGADSGLTGLLLAEAPLKTVPALEKKLDAELKRTT
jgi:hypothetical protein